MKIHIAALLALISLNSCMTTTAVVTSPVSGGASLCAKAYKNCDSGWSKTAVTVPVFVLGGVCGPVANLPRGIYFDVSTVFGLKLAEGRKEDFSSHEREAGVHKFTYILDPYNSGMWED
ncbi:MAG: hypothetical protein RL095_753 [Verrucomicrobiota bacterium]|jgi:hypothetical protein